MEVAVGARDRDELRTRIRGLAPWMHPYRFGDVALVGAFKNHGLSETVTDGDSPPALRARHEAAYKDFCASQPEYLLDEVARRLGGLAGKSVLDIACATGRFTLQAARLGASATGVEIRPNQVEQARFVGELLESPAEFRHEELSADDPRYLEGEEFDVVLSFGLLYHLADPVQHLRNVMRLAREAVVIQTLTHWGAPHTWRLTLQEREWITKAAGGHGWIPHFADVPMLLQHVGFADVEPVVHPLAAHVQEPLLASVGSSRVKRRALVELAKWRMRRGGPELVRRENPAHFATLARR